MAQSMRTERTKPRSWQTQPQPLTLAIKHCGTTLSQYSRFLQQVFALLEDHPNKKQLSAWCARFGAKLVLHFADVKELKKKFTALEKDGDANYVDAMRRQMFTTKEKQHARFAYFDPLLAEVTSVRDKTIALCGKETHKKFQEELDVSPKIDS